MLVADEEGIEGFVVIDLAYGGSVLYTAQVYGGEVRDRI